MTILTLTKVDVGMMEDVGTSANNIIQLDSNGKIPAVDGSLLTGITSGLSGSSDPTISTNPSTGVGTKFKNTTDGELFICTDATAGSNVWTNVGAGSGDIEPFTFPGGGTAYGFTAGGGPYQSIERYAFASDANAIDTTYDLLSQNGEVGGASSSTHGYVMGGGAGDVSTRHVIEKFNMTTVANTTDVGDLAYADAHRCAGHMSATYGFASGGTEPNGVTDINRFAFASDGNAVDWGDLTEIKGMHSGHSSTTHGYTSGAGAPAPRAASNVIDKFPFASSAGSSDVGDLTTAAGYCPGGQQSETYGYRSGGRSGSPNVSLNTIDKFSFTTDGNATDVGDLTYARVNKCESSSPTHGYTAGGWSSVGAALTNVIDKHSFSVDENSTDVGDLSAANGYQSGHQI